MFSCNWYFDIQCSLHFN